MKRQLFFFLAVACLMLTIVMVAMAIGLEEPKKFTPAGVFGALTVVFVVFAVRASKHPEEIEDEERSLTGLEQAFLEAFGIRPPRPEDSDEDRSFVQLVVDNKLTERAIFAHGLFSAQETLRRHCEDRARDRRLEILDLEDNGTLEELDEARKRHAEEEEEEFVAHERLRDMIDEEKRSPNYFCALEALAHRAGLKTFHDRNGYVRGGLPY